MRTAWNDFPVFFLGSCGTVISLRLSRYERNGLSQVSNKLLVQTSRTKQCQDLVVFRNIRILLRSLLWLPSCNKIQRGLLVHSIVREYFWRMLVAHQRAYDITNLRQRDSLQSRADTSRLSPHDQPSESVGMPLGRRLYTVVAPLQHDCIKRCALPHELWLMPLQCCP